MNLTLKHNDINELHLLFELYIYLEDSLMFRSLARPCESRTSAAALTELDYHSNGWFYIR